MVNCDAACCTYGVFADIRERDTILAHAAIVRKHMEPHQAKETDRWFEEREIDDRDFPSGRAIGTSAMDYGCVFLDSTGRCVLQKAAVAEGMHPYALKPFYCIAYPITVDHGELMIDKAEFADRPRCCRASAEGTLDVFDVCGEELQHVLGDEGVEELRAQCNPVGNAVKGQAS